MRRGIGRKRRRKIGGDFYLPEPILQVVQSTLTAKEAARTTVLSKAWRSAWLTRSNFDFDFDDCKIDRKILIRRAGKTLRRYRNSNIKIESFRLCLDIPYDSNNIARRRVTNLIVKALESGATKLNLGIDSWDSELQDAVFRSENLVALTMKFGDIMNRVVIACSMLQSLSLECVSIQSLDVVSHILSSCPLLLTLSLCRIRHKDPHVAGDGLPTIHHHRLRSLVLDHLDFDALFLGDVSSKFSSLKDLTLSILWTEDPREILISSPSLERLDLTLEPQFIYKVNIVKLDVPNIRRLTFGCSTFPKLSITSNSRGWESHVSVTRSKCLSASWFCRLSKFLKKFRRSRISLSLHVSTRTAFDYEAGVIPRLPTPEIENLTIYHVHLPSLSCYALFDGLFRMCRPKVITQHMSTGGYWHWSTNNVHFLGKRLLDARDANALLTPNQFMYGLNDLTEARAQVLDKNVSEWRDLPLESFLDGSCSVAYRSVCFQLKWKQ